MGTLVPMEPNTTIETDATPEASAADENVVAELLVEEISIDGMCGVY